MKTIVVNTVADLKYAKNFKLVTDSQEVERALRSLGMYFLYKSHLCEDGCGLFTEMAENGGEYETVFIFSGLPSDEKPLGLVHKRSTSFICSVEGDDSVSACKISLGLQELKTIELAQSGFKNFKNSQHAMGVFVNNICIDTKADIAVLEDYTLEEDQEIHLEVDWVTEGLGETKRTQLEKVVVYEEGFQFITEARDANVTYISRAFNTKNMSEIFRTIIIN